MRRAILALLLLALALPAGAQYWGPLTLPNPTAADDLKYIQWNATTKRYQLAVPSVSTVTGTLPLANLTPGTAGQVLTSNATPVAAWSSSLAVGITATTEAATDTLTAAQVNGGVVNNYGQAAPNTLTLPTAAAGYNCIVVVSTAGAGALNVKAGASDKIYLDGVALDDGDKAALATPAVGNTLTCFTFQTGASAYDWICTSGGGAAWTDGGA